MISTSMKLRESSRAGASDKIRASAADMDYPFPGRDCVLEKACLSRRVLAEESENRTYGIVSSNACTQKICCSRASCQAFAALLRGKPINGLRVKMRPGFQNGGREVRMIWRIGEVLRFK